jgi:hypothetical protein
MSRLTKDLKAQILVNAMTSSGLPSKLADFYKEVADFAEKARTALISKNVEEKVAKIEKDLLSLNLKRNPYSISTSTDHSLYFVTHRGEKVELYFSGQLSYKKNRLSNESKSKTIPYQTIVNVKGSDAETVVQFGSREKAILEEIYGAKLTISGVLNSCNTMAQLIAKWPEAKEIIPVIEPKKQSTEVLDVNSLNKLVKLPGSKK